jgi:hypothetical protein
VYSFVVGGAGEIQRIERYVGPNRRLKCCFPYLDVWIRARIVYRSSAHQLQRGRRTQTIPWTQCLLLSSNVSSKHTEKLVHIPTVRSCTTSLPNPSAMCLALLTGYTQTTPWAGGGLAYSKRHRGQFSGSVRPLFHPCSRGPSCKSFVRHTNRVPAPTLTGLRAPRVYRGIVRIQAIRW